MADVDLDNGGQGFQGTRSYGDVHICPHAIIPLAYSVAFTSDKSMLTNMVKLSFRYPRECQPYTEISRHADEMENYPL